MLLVVIALASAQQAPKPTNGVAWGFAVDGLRIGAAFGSDPSKPTLRDLFLNVGSVEVQHVIIGAETGRGPIYNLKFIATAPDGMEREGQHVSAFVAVAGALVPLSIWLNAGGTHELKFPLTDIIYSPTAVRLDALVQQGYSVRVRLEANHPWIGAMSSAEVSLAH
jgi:hypothetical protein